MMAWIVFFPVNSIYTSFLSFQILIAEAAANDRITAGEQTFGIEEEFRGVAIVAVKSVELSLASD